MAYFLGVPHVTPFNTSKELKFTLSVQLVRVVTLKRAAQAKSHPNWHFLTPAICTPPSDTPKRAPTPETKALGAFGPVL